MTSFWTSIRRIVAAELDLFRHFPRLMLAAIAIVLVPAVYALIYLSSVWDPNAKTNALPVAIVNLDAGFSYQGKAVNMGSELTDGLVKTEAFGFKSMADVDEARHSVALGQLAFAVVIPRDFSANAVPGTQQGGGKLLVILSEGNNYASAGFAKRFAEDLGHQANEALNEKRWEQVLASADGSGQSLEKLRMGMSQLLHGAMVLDDNINKYSLAGTQLASGVKQVGTGLRALEAKMPAEVDMKAFKNGTQRMAIVQKELGTGLESLQAGATKMNEATAQLQSQTSLAPLMGEQLTSGLGEFASGSAQLKQGLTTAVETNARLIRGSGLVDARATKLIDAAGVLGDNLHTVISKLPEDAKMDSFVTGGRALKDGATRVRTGIELISAVLPATAGKPDGSARGLADSVQASLEILAPVANNGSAFAPNMVAMALWLGAVMTTYLFNLQLLLTEHQGTSRLARTLGKFALPAGMVLVQVVFIFLMLVFGLGIHAPSYLTFALTMVAAGLAFLAVVVLLVRAFGEAGKLIAVLLLTLQLAAGGGVMPIELTGDFFQAVHQWLPFTWVVKAFRASLFGAFDSGWLQAWTTVCLIGLIALAVTVFVGRWKLVSEAEFKPAIDP